jgi:hypothetical protein
MGVSLRGLRKLRAVLVEHFGGEEAYCALSTDEVNSGWVQVRVVARSAPVYVQGVAGLLRVGAAGRTSVGGAPSVLVPRTSHAPGSGGCYPIGVL